MLEELGIGVVPVRVYFGSENYLDKVTLTPSEFYARFAVTDEAPKTSQPPPADFTQVYENVAAHAGSIVSVHLSSAVSGTYQAASVGARPVREDDDRARRQPQRLGRPRPGRAGRRRSRRVGQGPGRGGGVSRAKPPARVRTFIAVPTLKHLVRGGRVSPLQAGSSRSCWVCCRS